MNLGYILILLGLILLIVSGVTAARNWRVSKTVRNTELVYIAVSVIMIGLGIYMLAAVPPVPAFGEPTPK
ncbi:hypothetical protein [Deinococcus maricopensis]|uniref:Uncharacterized protein n=1 Tax=Deinococcus maricopensis (strain DSM 21211 / LMG 22137 / NRRL B-23946 / LB-34) TaxID=709986 RepID=E8U8G6_DEIML|nr:hypothetical protein [Deinococcus maricopensis]ADV67355.1 hypothetical protein Deima_1706 [Deinococcus maricopensis DSM 21211]